MTTRRGSTSRLLCLAFPVLFVFLATASAPQAAEIDEHEFLIHTDGDLVVFGDHDEHTLARQTGAAAGRPGAGGYSLIHAHATLRGNYELRLVPGSGSDRLRPYLDAAARSASASPGVRVALSPQPGTHRPGAGQIDVRVTTSSPCSGAWLACGGPTLVANEIRSGRIWVHPDLLRRSSGDIRNTIMHELGHTLGLAHHSHSYGDRAQIMHPTSFAASAYEQGDRNGFAHIVANRPPMDGSIRSIRYAAGEVILTVDATRIDAGAHAEVDVRGEQTVSHDLRSGRNVVRASAPGGLVEACITFVSSRTSTTIGCARTSAPIHPFGNLERIEATPLGVRVVGWAIDPQTREPISVRVVASVLSLDHRAADSRRDVGRDHPDYGGRHGFDITRPIQPGPVRVCVYARNVGAGLDRPLGCGDVVVPVS